MYSQPAFSVIGITDSVHPAFSSEAEATIASSTVFSGGKRHYEIVKPYLPDNHLWIDITVPLEPVFKTYALNSHIVVFASGDPLFFGIAATLQREFPESSIKVYPTVNSIQLLASKALIPYHDVRCVSVTGRPWDMLDEALIARSPLIGILTDRHKTPASIARRMLFYGFDNYEMIVGERLGNELLERVSVMTLHQAAEATFTMPNNVILRQIQSRPIPFGIPDRMFTTLPGRQRMITKMPVRLTSIAMLDLHGKSRLWDIGFCTGSISIEAKLRFPALKVTSFEVRQESEEIIQSNCRKFGVPGIDIVIGDFFDADIESIPTPDAVFIGGHGGRLDEMVRRIDSCLLPGGVIVFNSVSSESLATFSDAIASVGRKIVQSHRIALDDFNPITIMKAI